MSTQQTGSTNTPPKTDVNSAGGTGKPHGSTGYREPGLKRMETTALFRVTNFELFIKPNTWVMILGVVAFSGCIGYISYVNFQNKKKKLYMALADDGTLQTRAKISRWD